MIFPWLTGVKYLKNVSFIWVLLGLNIFIFMATTVPDSKRSLELEKILASHSFAKVQVFHYQNYLKNSHNEKPEDLESVEQLFEHGEVDLKYFENILLQISLRDGLFIEKVLKNEIDMPPFGDQVLDTKWKSAFKEFFENHKLNMQSVYGLSSFGHHWSHFFTYQFIHSGFAHLISNMIVLFTFGIAVEVYYGAFILGFLYLMGGLFGALFFVLVGGLSVAPLIGASASVSAIVGFYLVAEERKNVSFFYFLTPIQDYFGEIYLSKWWLIPMALINDITGVLSHPGWMTSVAYSAHLGATFFGLVMGLIYMKWKVRFKVIRQL